MSGIVGMIGRTSVANGDLAVLRRDGIEVRDSARRVSARPVLESTASAMLAQKGSYRHFIIKEIYEQPEVVSHTLEHYINAGAERIELPARLPFDFAALSRLSILACGSTYYAALIAKYWFEIYARLSVEVDLASEYRCRATSLSTGDVSMVVPQSGETADTLACLGCANQRGEHTLSVVNVPTSSLARKSDVVMPILAGSEVGAASTKAFTCQLAALACLAIAAGKVRGVISPLREQMLVRSVRDIPRLMNQVLGLERDIETLARQLAESRKMLFLGRGTSYPLALEAALKVKELSYIHAEGYAAGELKHGPIALIDETASVIVIAPYDNVFSKTVSNIQEVAARGGKVILITDRVGQTAAPIKPHRTILLPNMPAFITPLVYAIPLQLMAYHIALQKRNDVDQPRNLAKSVTVE
jgi:glucosamine--fructose-6-phosphate aminotransferase (isomerizing)